MDSPIEDVGMSPIDNVSVSSGPDSPPQYKSQTSPAQYTTANDDLDMLVESHDNDDDVKPDISELSRSISDQLNPSILRIDQCQPMRSIPALRAGSLSTMNQSSVGVSRIEPCQPIVNVPVRKWPACSLLTGDQLRASISQIEPSQPIRKLVKISQTLPQHVTSNNNSLSKPAILSITVPMSVKTRQFTIHRSIGIQCDYAPSPRSIELDTNRRFSDQEYPRIDLTLDHEYQQKNWCLRDHEYQRKGGESQNLVNLTNKTIAAVLNRTNPFMPSDINPIVLNGNFRLGQRTLEQNKKERGTNKIMADDTIPILFTNQIMPNETNPTMSNNTDQEKLKKTRQKILYKTNPRIFAQLLQTRRRLKMSKQTSRRLAKKLEFAAALSAGASTGSTADLAKLERVRWLSFQNKIRKLKASVKELRGTVRTQLQAMERASGLRKRLSRCQAYARKLKACCDEQKRALEYTQVAVLRLDSKVIHIC